MNNTSESRQKAAHAAPGQCHGALPSDCVERGREAYDTGEHIVFETANNRPGPAHRPAGLGLCPSCGSGNTYPAGYTINGSCHNTVARSSLICSYRQRYSCRDCDFAFWQLEK